MNDKKEKLALILLVIFAVLLGGGFYAYYRMGGGGEPKKVDNSQSEQQKQGNGSQKALPEAEQYIEKLKVVFTSEEVPTNIPQKNPRLKTYVGKIKNTGEKTLSYVNIKVVYLDQNEKAIWEKNIPVSATLKPNYIQEFSFGGSDVPSDWGGKVTHEITKIRFEKDEIIREISPYYYRNRGLDRPLQQILFPLL